MNNTTKTTKATKTTEEWLKELPQEIQGNIPWGVISDEMLKRSQKSLADSLAEAFRWSETNQGIDYWSTIYDDLNT